jgi:hypothetical protein
MIKRGTKGRFIRVQDPELVAIQVAHAGLFMHTLAK